jgi:hypothetical protein
MASAGRQGTGALAAHQGLHGGEGDRAVSTRSRCRIQAQFLQFTGESGAVAADRLCEGLGSGGFQPQPQLPGGLGHQVDLAGPIPDGGQGEALLEHSAGAGLLGRLVGGGLGQLLQGLGGAQAAVGFARIHQHQVAALGDQLQARLQLVGQLGRALVAERAALQQHQPRSTPERWGAGLLQGLGRLAGIVAVQAAEVDRRPGRIHQPLDQPVHRPGAGRFVVTPEQVDGHQQGAGDASLSGRWDLWISWISDDRQGKTGKA